MVDADTDALMSGASDARTRVRLLLAVAALGAIVLIGLISTMGEANRQRDRALVLQTQSSQVTLLARTLSATTARAEAALGRYVISADNRLGVLYGEQWRSAGAQINQLEKASYTDNAGQQKRIAALRQAYRERSDELQLIALSTRYKKNDQALARYYQARESKPLLRINALLDDIIDAERQLLTARTDEALQSVKRSTDAALVLVYGECGPTGEPAGDVLGRIAQAEKWLQRMPRDGALLLTLGRLCRQQQLWGKARSYLEAALAIAPTRAAHVELAQLLDHLEESALAGRHYRAAAVL
jgi:tetratricopeptide (TPR) repeat protein